MHYLLVAVTKHRQPNGSARFQAHYYGASGIYADRYMVAYTHLDTATRDAKKIHDALRGLIGPDCPVVSVRPIALDKMPAAYQDQYRVALRRGDAVPVLEHLGIGPSPLNSETPDRVCA